MTTLPLLLIGCAVILFAAEFLTNAIDWLGHQLGVSRGPLGGVVAAFRTRMPEMMIPVIAIIFVGTSEADEVGTGAILGAPFLLSTAAFAVAGSGLFAFQGRRRHGAKLAFDSAPINRDLSFFIVIYLAGISSSFLPGHGAKVAVAIGLVLAYFFYVARRTTLAGERVDEGALFPLRFHRILGGRGTPSAWLAWAQLAAALSLVVGGAYIFIAEIEEASKALHVPVLILSLVIAPLATELPETFNSIISMREGKDTLAIGSISGSMAFQSCIPVCVGVAFTPWELTEVALVSAYVALASTGMIYVSVLKLGYLSAAILTRAGIFWVGFVSYVIVKLM